MDRYIVVINTENGPIPYCEGNFSKMEAFTTASRAHEYFEDVSIVPDVEYGP